MPTSFTSYWGSSIHGVEIKWTHDVASPEYLNFEYTCNYYYKMPFWYDAGSNNPLDGPDVGLADAIGATLGTNMSAGGAVTYDNSAEKTGNARLKYRLQFFVQNPVTTTEYDGFDGIAYGTVKVGSGDGVTAPTVHFEWQGTTSDPHNFDLKPSADFTIDVDGGAA